MMREALEQAVAVVGLGCVLPDAPSPDAFWQNTLRGHSALRPLGGPQWERCFDADAAAPDRSYTLVGARVERYGFDWRKFRMPPAEIERVNPLQLMILEAGVAALSELRALPAERTGVVLGATGLGWQRDSGLRIRMGELCEAAARSPRLAALPRERREQILASARAALESRLQPVSEDNVVNAAASVAAGRIAMHLDLRGLHYAVDAGFASSLASLDVGVRLLRDRTLDAVLVGGASELLTPLELVAFAKLGGLARQRVAPFDASAEGTLLGEGAVTLALKRLQDAVRDGDKIYAVVRGVGGSSDGRGRALCAPSWEGQALAMRRAYADGGVPPESVGFVECHATGTRVGDVSEVRALASVYEGAAPGVALGSAKPFVGHLRAAAGAVGLLRATLALHHRVAPGQINFSAPSPALELERTPFFVPTREHALGARGGASAPRAAVSAFGFGGNNFHAVLEAWDGAARPVSVAVPAAAPAAPEPIAIIGMGGAFPGADGVDAFWHLLERGADTTREVPRDRWDIDRYYDPDRDRQETCYTRLGCFLERLPDLEERWRIPPAAAPTIDPGQLLMLKVTEEALADAGFDPGRAERDGRWDRDRVAVMLAFLPYQGKKFLADVRVNCGELLDALSLSLREAGVPVAEARAILDEAEAEMKAGLPPITEDTLTGYLGSINAARITSHFDFHGPHLAVDSACASAHAALHAAVQGLRQRTCDVAIAGGTWCDMMPEFFIAACRFQALSARGSTPFGAGADGFVPGEGAGALVLRRLSDAERDGQKIYAVIRAVAGSSDGRGRSVLAPSPAGEALAMTRALQEAGVAPAEVDYVECHGTGTALGDAVEVEACTRAYGPGRQRPLLIGSVKSNIGHLNAAAGVPALIKAALAVQKGQIPASLKAEVPNPKIDFGAGPVQVVTTATPWPRPESGVRRAGVSSFGVGGSNLHVLIEEHRPTVVAAAGGTGGPGQGGRGSGAASRAQGESDEAIGSSEVLPIAAATGDSVAACVEELRVVVEGARGLRGKAYLAALRGGQERAAARVGPCRVAIVAETPEELDRRFELLRVHGARPGSLLQKQGIFIGNPAAPPRVAVVFPGQGPQYADMLRDAARRFPLLRDTLGEIDRAYEALCGRKLTASFFTGEGAPEEQRDEDIHCAVFAVGCALFRLFCSYGLRPGAVMGQSAGELAALVAAGVLALPDALRAMRERTLAVLSLDLPDPGQMVTLSCGASATAGLLRGLPGYATIAADNSPAACIVSAERAVVGELLGRCAAAGVEAQALAVSHGYHSRLIAGAQPRYRAVLEELTFRRPACDVVSTVTGESLRDLAGDAYPAHLARQYVEPVRLVRAVETLYDSGVRLFLECGPKWPLTSFIGQILGGRPHLAQAAMHPKVGEVEQIHRALGCLFASGLADLFPVPTTSVARAVEVPAPPTEVKEMRQAGPTQDELIALLRSIHERVGAVLERWEQASAGPREDAATPAAPTSRAPEVPEQPQAVAVPAATWLATPAPASMQAPSPAVREPEVRAAFLRRVMDRTGYPEDMLDLDLDLEADLGIDTVKQIAIVADTRASLGLPQDPDFKLRDHGTPRKIISYLLSRLSSTAAPATATPQTTRPPTGARPASVPPTQLAATAAAVAPSPAVTAASASPATAAAPAPSVREPEVRAAFLRRVMDRTGYPEDMLDLDLDLEADLGIDTVKQIAIVADTRAFLGLPQDPDFKLRDHGTPRKIISYLLSRLASVTATPATAQAPAAPRPAAPAVPAAPAAPRGPRVLLTRAVAAGAPGTHAGADARPLVTESRCLQLLLSAARRERAAGRLSRLEDLRVGEPAFLPPAGPLSLEVEAEDVPAGLRCRVSSGAATHLSASVFFEDAGAAPALPPEIRVVLDRRGKPQNGMALLTSTRRGAPQSPAQPTVMWAWGSRFDEVVGGLRLGEVSEEVPEAALAELLISAFWLADFGWYGLSGAVHWLASLRAARFFATPRPGDELLLHARLLPPEGGTWGADVTIADGSLQVVAQLQGLRGRPAGQLAGALGVAGAAEEAAVDWQHFYRRMHSQLLEGEDRTW